MKNNKFIQVLVDEETHKEFRGILKKRGRGERVKYVCGDVVNKAMKRTIEKENGDKNGNGI